ncbi:MAG: hypothetical protein ACI9N1_002679 [Flavobacteriales bacterium]|jgi:hypothetical protein
MKQYPLLCIAIDAYHTLNKTVKIKTIFYLFVKNYI